jgi:hypothetical protein
MRTKFVLIFFNIIFLYCTQGITTIYADTVPSNIINNKIFIIGVQKFDSLIELNIDKTDIWMVTEKKNLEYVSNVKASLQPYLILDTIAYIREGLYHRLWYYLLDGVSSELRDMLLDSYPHFAVIFKNIKIFEDGNKMYQYKQIKYWNFQCQLFLVLLIHLPFYNEILSHTLPIESYFPNHPALQGMYVKILIPLKEDEEDE